MKVALIGAGGIGCIHLDVYKMMPDVELIAIVDIDAVKAGKNAGSERIKIYRSIEELLELEKPDMVDICTPTYLHAEHAIKAMERGVHVLCEKPISLDLESARKMHNAAVENNVFFMVAHVIRFWPEYMYLKKALAEKTYGKLKNAVFNRISPRPSWSWNDWMMDMQKSGRAAVDLHIHDADFILYLLGKPESVTAYSIEDGLNISSISSFFEYDSMYIETKGAWYNAPIPFEMSFRACFENTVLEFSNNNLMIYEHGKEVKNADIDTTAKLASGININSLTGYYNEIMYFIQCIREEKPPVITTPESSIESLEIVLKELQSAGMRQKVII